MALRAGYYGVKRRIKDKIEEIAGSWDETINSLFPRSEQSILGAKNLFEPVVKSGATINGVTMTFLADGVHLSGTATGTATGSICGRYGGSGPYRSFKNGSYIVSGGVAAKNIRLICGVTKSGAFSQLGEGTGDIPITVNGDDGSETSAYVLISISVPKDTVTDGVVIRPMVRLGTDTDNTYVPYSMTNQELTTSATDQKTAINAIITAATEAADFAAFKTAMGAITPVNRSLYIEGITEPDSKSITEEPVVEKKTTKKKSTAKAETQEEV